MVAGRVPGDTQGPVPAVSAHRDAEWELQGWWQGQSDGKIWKKPAEAGGGPSVI